MPLQTFTPIASPPWTKLGKKLESSCRKALYQYKMLENTSKVAIALSGGKDSLTLLFLLKAISGRGFPKVDLCAIHISGAFSCGASVQESYLKGICDRLEIPLITRTAEQKLETLECYSCSRTRRKLIFDAAKEMGATTIAFGHHRDDNAQTLMMNLLQKGEFAGMLPYLEMVDYGVTIIRPLILIPETQIKEFAKEYAFAKITCRCPVGQDSHRKKIDNILSELEEHFPHARLNISRSSLLYGSQKAQKKPNHRERLYEETSFDPNL